MRSAKKKLLFIIPNLGGGGAERVLVNVIRKLDQEVYDLSLILFEKRGVFLADIPDGVKVIDLKKRSAYSFLKLVYSLCFVIKKQKPDIVISFLRYANIIAILAKVLSAGKFKLVITVHIYLSETLLHLKYAGLWTLVYKKLFKYSDYIVVPSNGVMNDLVEHFSCDRDKVGIISHPFNINEIKQLSSERIDEDGFDNPILSVGRLTKQKGFDVLIHSYKLISDSITEKLVILGVGEEEENLKQLVREYGLQNRVVFLGYKENPFKYMKNAKVFVLSSLWESFALVIVEAMLCGVPVISTDCPYGPGEIISNNVNGILIPVKDEKKLAEAVYNVLNDEALRTRLSDEGKKRAEDFNIDKIMPKYEELFNM